MAAIHVEDASGRVCVCVKNDFFHNRIDYILHHCPLTQYQSLLDDIGLIELWYVARFPMHITFITNAAIIVKPMRSTSPVLFFSILIKL